MATKIQLKRSSTASDVPVAGDLAVGEVAVNTADGTLFTKHTDNSIKTISAGPIYQATNTNNVAGVWKATIPEITAYEDGQIIAFYPNKIDGIGGDGTTFEINSLGAKTVTRPDSNETAITTHYDGTNLIFLRYVSADDYFIVHANYNTTDDYRIRYEHHVTANNSAGSGTAWHGYQLLMEGIDGKFYPVTEGGSTANTNAVSTAELRVGGVMLIYHSGTDRTANTNVGGYSLYESGRLTSMEFWNNRDEGWATAYRPWYIVATINANGNFVLDNTSYTSFLTQDLPTSDDGKYYIHGGLMLDTYDDYRLQVNHPIYVYKNGAVREWSGYASNADQLDGVEASSFLRSDAADTATGALTFGNTITLNGSQTGSYPSLNLQPGSSSTAYIMMGASADPDEGMITYSPSSNTMGFTAGTDTVLNLTNTTIEAKKDITLPDNEYVKFGASNDLTIGHGATYGTNTIDSTQSLYISTDNSIQFRKGNFQGEFLAQMAVDGAVSLYYDNSKKFETTSTGILASGDIKFGGSDNGILEWKTSTTPGPFSGQFSEYIILQNKASSTEQELYLIDTGDGNDGDIFGIASNNAPVFAITGNSAIKLMHPNTSSYDVTIEPTTPTSNRTLTLPNATGGVEVLKKTDFNLTPGASSVTLSISDVILSGTPRQNRILFCMDTMTPSSGPNNPILSIGHTSGTVSWSGSYAYTTGVDGSISGTDLLAGLTSYNYPYDGWTVELIRTNGNTWIVKVQAGLGSSGTYFATCKASAYLTGITIQTGSSYTWSAIKGSLYEYY